LLTGGEDGVVNAWSLLDLVDEEDKRQIHPFRTWSEHHLPVSAICVLKGSGIGCTRFVSCSLDRHLIIMEVGGASASGGLKSIDGSGGARTLARMCLPSGLHCVISDSLSSRLYAAGADGNIYCVDIDRYAIHETMDGAAGGTVVHVNQVGKSQHGVDFASIMSGSHVMKQQSSTASSLIDQTKYMSELKGHTKAVVSLVLLDPADLASTPASTKATCLLASGSLDGTVRIFDLRSRSFIKVLRPYAPSSEGMSITSASSATSSPPITALIAVPKSSLTSINASLNIAPVGGSQYGRRSHGFEIIVSIFKPLKRFVRGTSTLQDNDHADCKVQSEDCVVLMPQVDSFSVTDTYLNDTSFSRQNKRAKT
jgi:WD40 repeat protein